ncbi:short-chain dehydrogenase [Nocardia neocaledoniensis NBRC 108232]|uniref:NAD(P)-dependent dehydrogenase (Short-subunit alcohol dehydrogenase family) n=1 Tax=Nocardia neocaledoniensis TaxID=236511 RepID=A0A317N1P3_9NOCA|nr:SDR family NAD(P)-dependent oxidoreductase [Nocardia neocaledoniensis]PWV67562.1 NAD(P)-dependent dehydrogenase (short-subunit alcohol dehydrogenase family) [Nocardia neocaledoniensis]GEM31260.1 short-chain dehydrogenase [Nocardia neocaledoniensis NBRC 108232]
MTQQSALVTGGASGMGRASVARFLDRGFGVVIADLNEEVAQRTVAEFTDHGAGDRVRFVRTDVSEEADFEAAVSRTRAEFGRLDVLVNAAGVGGAFGPLTEIEVADWDYTFDVVLRSVFLGTKHAGRVMREQGTGGAIVNFGSIGAQAAGIGVQAYSVAKAGVEHLTRMASLEFAPDRIRVNAVSPGIITTPLIGMTSDDLAPVLGTIQPLPYAGVADHVAAVVSFLASEEAAFITGEVITVDGGMMAAGPQLGDLVNNNPALRGLVGVNRGSTGARSTIHRKVEVLAEGTR